MRISDWSSDVCSSDLQLALPTGHRQIDVRQQARIEQGTVEVAIRIVDRVTLAQGIEIDLLPRMQASRHLHRVGDLADLVEFAQDSRARKFGVEKAHVE